MVMTYAAQFTDAVENFTTTLALHNAAMDDMRKIHAAYKARRDADAKEVEYQRNHLTYVMGDDSFPATERAEAKQKLAQLEFHTCLPTLGERMIWCRLCCNDLRHHRPESPMQKSDPAVRA